MHWLWLAVFVIICEGVGGVAGFVSSASVSQWYSHLNKPSWNPPSWVFGPVWTLLYLLMAVCVWLIWRRVGFAQAGGAYTLFAIQLGLNFMWSILFFRMHNPGLAMLDLIFLWLAIVATGFVFGRIYPLAGWLWIPYIIWVAFAGILNWRIWMLNR